MVRLFRVLALALIFPAPRLWAQPLLWAVNDGEKIFRDALNHPARKGNSVWDGRTIRLFGCRGEVLSFQVMAEGQGGPMKITDLKLGFEEPSLAAGVEVFSEHYLPVMKNSPDADQGGWFWYKAAAPLMAPAWLPDALIPLRAKPDRGGLPLSVATGQLQGFWFDLSLPPLKAGVYKGNVQVQMDRAELSLPLELELLDLELPQDDLVKTMVYISDPDRRYHSQGKDLRREFRFMAHRHRFQPIEYVPYDFLDKYKAYLTGEAYTQAQGYQGPGQGLGHAVFAVDMYGVGTFGKTEAEWRAASDRWMLWFNQNAPKVLPFLYLEDEPGEARFHQLKTWASWIHNNPGPGGKLPVFLTKEPQPGLEGAVDIWATVADRVHLKEVAERRAKGQRWWYYNGMRPMSGSGCTDAPAVDMRVQTAICWLYGVDLWFYWESTHWQHNNQGPRARKDQNVFLDPITFESQVQVNGDGLLFYPGEDVFFPDQDRGLDEPLPSIRMKNLRRGQQDLAYVQLAIRAGHEAEARALYNKLIPRAFDLASRDEAASWPQDGDSWDRLRRSLAALALPR